MDKNGLVHVYTGFAKGKTTAAIGLAVRALGQGLKVLLVQFLKGESAPSGEILFLSDKPGIEIIRFADQRHPLFKKEGEINIERLKESVRLGLETARKKMLSGDFDFVVLDEINNCMKEGWLDPEEIVKLIREKPAKVEIALTGRGCPKKIMELADYVTEMHLIKHPAKDGVTARKGVEF